MSTLELRYRRLLAWYPRDHRAAHEDEMIGVLLAGAHPGQSRPDPREAADLMLAALRLRVRRAFHRGSAGPWRDALAVTGAVGLVLTMLHAATTVISVSMAGLGVWTQVFFRPADLVQILLPLTMSVVTLAAAAANLRRVTPAAAWGLVVAMGAAWAMIKVPETQGEMTLRILPQTDGWLYLAVLTAVALTFAPRPRRGLALLGTRRLVRWAVIMLAVLTWSPLAAFHLPSPPIGSRLTEELPFIAAALVATGLALRTPIGRRSAALLAVPLAVHLTVSTYLITWIDGWLMGVLALLVPAGILAGFARRLVLGRASRPSADTA